MTFKEWLIVAGLVLNFMGMAIGMWGLSMKIGMWGARMEGRVAQVEKDLGNGVKGDVRHAFNVLDVHGERLSRIEGRCAVLHGEG